MSEVKSFNLADSIQAGIRFFARQPLTIVKSGGGLAIALSAIFVFLTYLSNNYLSKLILSIVFEQFDFFALIMTIVVWLVWFALTVAFVAYLGLAYYRLASGRERPALVWQLGSADSPLVGVRADEALIIKTALKRIFSLWALVVAAVLLALGEIIGFFATILAQGQNDDGGAARVVALVLTMLGYLALVTGIWAVTRRFLFLAPVIVDTGEADRRAVKAPVPGFFPAGLFRAQFLKSAGLVLIAYLPVWLINWLMAEVMSRSGGQYQVSTGNPFFLFLDALVSLAAIVLAMAFVGGALAHIWRQRQGESQQVTAE